MPKKVDIGFILSPYRSLKTISEQTSILVPENSDRTNHSAYCRLRAAKNSFSLAAQGLIESKVGTTFRSLVASFGGACSCGFCNLTLDPKLMAEARHPFSLREQYQEILPSAFCFWKLQVYLSTSKRGCFPPRFVQTNFPADMIKYQ